MADSSKETKKAQLNEEFWKETENDLRETQDLWWLNEKVVDGKKNIKSLKIDSSILNEDVEMVEDLIMAAIKQAYTNIEHEVGDKMNSITGGMSIPGML